MSKAAEPLLSRVVKPVTVRVPESLSLMVAVAEFCRILTPTLDRMAIKSKVNCSVFSILSSLAIGISIEMEVSV